MTIGGRVIWLWRRLRVMSAAELVARVQDQWFLLRLRWRHERPPADLPQEPPASDRNPEFHVGDVSLDVSAIANDYSALLEGELNYGGGDWHFEDDATAWHREHTTLRDWPQTFFNSIDYRPGNPVGDVRRSWEPARLQHLIALAVRSRDLGFEKRGAHADLALSMIERQLASWWRFSPPYHGIHYVSAMECGLRCIAVSHVAAMLESRGQLTSGVRAIVLALLTQHAGFIRRRISTHSSAGNHTLAETAGLIYACLMLPERPESSRDEHFATMLFAKELDRQVLTDGGGLEQATWYHRFNIELAECVSRTLEVNNRPVPELLTSAIERGGRFLRAVEAAGSSFVRIGDADDGYALSRYYNGRWRALPLPEAVEHFIESGVTCIRRHGWNIIVLHGPLGMPPSYGHGHADALSVLVTVDGAEVLCDSGTGAYSGENARQRQHFRSCEAHNTVQAGSGDFSRALSAFMWSHPYQCELAHRDSGDERVELWMTLSVHVSTPYTVHRYFCLTRDEMTVIDHVHSPDAGRATQRWHFPVEVSRPDPDVTRFVPRSPGGLCVEISGGESVCVKQRKRSTCYGELESVSVLSQEIDMSSAQTMCMRLTRSPGQAVSLASNAPVSSFASQIDRAREHTG